MNKKKKITKFIISTLTSSLIASIVVCAAVSCSNQTNSSSNEEAKTSKINVNGKSYSKNANLNISYGKQIILTASNTNNQNAVYKWYCNGQLLKNDTGNKLVVSSGSQINKYYVETTIDGVQTKSSTITVTPTFDSSLFSAAIVQQANNQKTINDINNTSYSLRFELLYNSLPFSLQPNNISWTLNNKEVSQTSDSFTPNLTMGKNVITASFNDLPSFFGIKNNTLTASLTINYAQLQISCANLNNNEVTVNYDSSITLNLTNDSLQSLKNAGINVSNVSYHWYKNNQEINGYTSQTATFNNLQNNATYYLKTTYSINNQTYTLTSNEIKVNVNNIANLNNIKVVYNNNNANTLNLNNTSIKKAFNFSISYNNLSNSTINGTAVYNLINTSTQKSITLTKNDSLLNSSLSINFDDLNGFVPGIYKLYATISIQEANNHTFTYSNTQILPLTITYDPISINAIVNSNVYQIAQSNSYNVNVGSSVTLQVNDSNDINNTNATYQWQELLNGSWINLKNNANNSTFTLSNITSQASLTYRLIEEVNNLTLTSNSITIIPILTNEIKASITSNNNKAVNNSLNIYNQSQQSQTLTLSFSNLNINDLVDLNIEWFVNNKQYNTGSNTTFIHTYDIGTNTVSVNVSYSLNGETKTLTDIASFSINYYGLNIKVNNPNILTGMNVDSKNIIYLNSNIYSDAIYQWVVNGKDFGNTLTQKPTTLPTDNITSNTTFQLVISNANDSTAPVISSNIITIDPISQTETVIQYINNAIKNPITLPSSYTNTAAQSLNSTNISNTIAQIKAVISNEIFHNQSIITIGDQTYSPQQILQDLNIVLPTSVSYENNLAGILQNVQITYGNEANILATANQKLNNIINSPQELANIIESYFNLNPSLLLSWIQCWGLGYQLANNVSSTNFNQYFSINSCSFDATQYDFLQVSLTINQPIQITAWNNDTNEPYNIGYAKQGTVLNITLPFQTKDFSASLSSSGNSIISSNIWNLINPGSSNSEFQTSYSGESDNYHIGWTLTGSNLPSQYTSGTFVYTNFNQATNSSMASINLTSNNTNNALQNFNIGLNIANNANSTYEVVGFKDASLNNVIQEQDIAAELGSLIGNEISLNKKANITAQEVLNNLNNQTNLINQIKDIITKKINNNLIIINNIAYNVSQILSSLEINFPSFISLANDQNGILPNVTLTYNGYNLKNANGIYFYITNLNNSSTLVTKDETQAILALFNKLISNNTIALINYHYSANQSLQTQYKNDLINAIKTAIINELQQSVFIANKIQFNLNQITNIIQNLTINLPNQASQIDETSGILQNVSFSYNNQNLNNTYTITNLAKINNNENSTSLNIAFAKSAYNINTQNGVTLSNFKLEPEVSNWQSGSQINYYLNINSENVSNLLVGSYNSITAFTFSSNLIKILQNNPNYLLNKYLVITLIATISNQTLNINKSCTTQIIINNNQLFLYAISNNKSSINLNCYTNQTYSLFFNNYLSNSTNNTFELISIVNEVKTTKTITLSNYQSMQGILLNAVANTGTITYYLQELNANGEVIATSNQVVINCNQIGGISLTNTSINNGLINVNLNTSSTVILNIQKNLANINYDIGDIYYEVAAQNNEWLPITQSCNLFDIQLQNNEIILSNLASNISINIKIMNITNNLYSNVVTIKTNAPSSMWNNFTYNNQALNMNSSTTSFNINKNQIFDLTFNKPNINLANVQYTWAVFENSSYVTTSNTNVFTKLFSNLGNYIVRFQINWLNNYSAQTITYYFKVNVNATASEISSAQKQLEQFASNSTNELNVLKAYWNINPNTLLPWINTWGIGYQIAGNVNDSNFNEYFSIQTVNVNSSDHNLIQILLKVIQPIDYESWNASTNTGELVKTLPINTYILVTTPYQLTDFNVSVNSVGQSLMQANITNLIGNNTTFNNNSNDLYKIGWMISTNETNFSNAQQVYINFNMLDASYIININSENSNNTLPNYINSNTINTIALNTNTNKIFNNISLNYLTKNIKYTLWFNEFILNSYSKKLS